MKKVLLIVLILAAAAIARAQNTGDSENGKKLFLADGCWQCHNYNGSGGRQGARLAQTKLTAQGLITYIRKPRSTPACLLAFARRRSGFRAVVDSARGADRFRPGPPCRGIHSSPRGET